jgi:putative peptidoglycan lipid II flippase
VTQFASWGILGDDVALLLLIVVGAIVYAGSILALFGAGWLRSLVRS